MSIELVSGLSALHVPPRHGTPSRMVVTWDGATGESTKDHQRSEAWTQVMMAMDEAGRLPDPSGGYLSFTTYDLRTVSPSIVQTETFRLDHEGVDVDAAGRRVSVRMSGSATSATYLDAELLVTVTGRAAVSEAQLRALLASVEGSLA